MNKYTPRNTEFVVISRDREFLRLSDGRPVVSGEDGTPITFDTRHEAHRFGEVFRPHTVKPINSLAAQGAGR